VAELLVGQNRKWHKERANRAIVVSLRTRHSARLTQVRRFAKNALSESQAKLHITAHLSRMTPEPLSWEHEEACPKR
jgi:hypothetical protein